MRRHATRLSLETPYGADLTGRSRLRRLEATGAADTLPQSVRDAFLGGSTGLDGIVVSAEALLELESNRSLVGPVQLYWCWQDYYLNMGAAPFPLVAVDTTVDDPQVIVDNRRNASVAVAVADFSRTDDPNAVAAGEPGSGESMPWGLEARAELTVRGADAPSSGHTWTRVGGATTTIATVADGTSPHPSGRAFELTGATTGAVLAPSSSIASYWLPFSSTQRQRVWTAAAYVRTTAAPFTGRWRLTFNPGGLNPVTYASAPFTVAGGQPFARVAARILTTNVVAGSMVLGTSYRTMRLELEVITGATGTRVAAPQVYAGEDRGLMAGLTAACIPYGGVLVSLRYRNPANTASVNRRVTRVDVHGDARLGGPTSLGIAAVVPGPFEQLGIAAGEGPLSIWTTDRLLSELWLTVEEVNTGAGGYLWLNEVDAQTCLDVSDRVVSLGVKRSREVEAAGTTLPVGTFEAASCSLALDNTLDGYGDDLSRSGNAAISSNHRLELGVRITAAGVTYSLPVGVFYSNGWDSGDLVVQIEGVDRLGRDRDVDAGTTAVMRNQLLADELVRLSLSSLDFDVDARRFNVSSYAAAYLYPEGAAGPYLADLVKALNAVAYVDELETLVVEERARIPLTSAITLHDGNAIVDVREAAVEDVIVNDLTVTGAPLVADAAASVVAALAETAIEPIPNGGGASLILPYSGGPAIDVELGATAAVGYPGGAPLLFTVTPYATFARVGILNGAGATITLTKLELSGKPLKELPISVSRTNASSRRRFGPRSRELVVKYAQTVAQLGSIGDDLIGTFAGVDPVTGGTSLPDLEVSTLGLPHVELGDRAIVSFPRRSIGGEYQLLEHALTLADRRLQSAMRVRRADTTTTFAIADVSLADDVGVAAY